MLVGADDEDGAYTKQYSFHGSLSPDPPFKAGLDSMVTFAFMFWVAG
jgi:hypothetical protein